MKELQLIVGAEDFDIIRLREMLGAFAVTIRDLVEPTVHYVQLSERIIDLDAEQVGEWEELQLRQRIKRG